MSKSWNRSVMTPIFPTSVKYTNPDVWSIICDNVYQGTNVLRTVPPYKKPAHTHLSFLLTKRRTTDCFHHIALSSRSSWSHGDPLDRYIQLVSLEPRLVKKKWFRFLFAWQIFSFYCIYYVLRTEIHSCDYITVFCQLVPMCLQNFVKLKPRTGLAFANGWTPNFSIKMKRLKIWVTRFTDLFVINCKLTESRNWKMPKLVEF